MPVSKLFTDETCNIVADVFAQASVLDLKLLSTIHDDTKSDFYEYLPGTPYASLVVEFTMALEEIGYIITKEN